MTSNIVTLQVGQCGIQLGASLLEALSQQESREEYTDCFFRTQKLVASDSHSIKGTIERTVARSVLVDMEPKAVNATVRTTSKEWNYDARSCFTQQSGSGNNWARGFHQYGERYADDILDRVRREVEKCDLFGGFLLMQSLAGGTGSGLGARLAQELKQEYPSTFLLNNCIWPYESGEVIVQNYNTLLTLASLNECSDGVILTENESLHQTCQRKLDIERPTFKDLNDVASKSLASILLPAKRRSVDGSSWDGGSFMSGPPDHNLLSSLVEHLCPHPSYRMLSLKCVPQVPPKALSFTEFKWPTILKWLRQMLIVSSSVDECLDWGIKIDSGSSINRVHCKSVANLLFMRGQGASTADVSLFADKALYPKWSTEPLGVLYNEDRFYDHEMFATLLSNSQASTVPIRNVLDRAYSMLHERAYVHHYEKCGLSYTDMEIAFAQIEDTIEKYDSI